MGWERGRYYTRSKKVNGRVVREYVGAGELGALAAELDAIEREQREMEALECRSQRDQAAEQDAQLDEFGEKCDLLVTATLVAAGYRRHHRGEWRKKRGGSDQSE